MRPIIAWAIWVPIIVCLKVMCWVRMKVMAWMKMTMKESNRPYCLCLVRNLSHSFSEVSMKEMKEMAMSPVLMKSTKYFMMVGMVIWRAITKPLKKVIAIRENFHSPMIVHTNEF